jgi:hypothetical protein
VTGAKQLFEHLLENRLAGRSFRSTR